MKEPAMRLILTGHPVQIREHLTAALRALDAGTPMIWAVSGDAYVENPVREVEFIIDGSLDPSEPLYVEED
jgi:hypothetical protein